MHNTEYKPVMVGANLVSEQASFIKTNIVVS
jgi:hypothetical protein